MQQVERITISYLRRWIRIQSFVFS